MTDDEKLGHMRHLVASQLSDGLALFDKLAQGVSKVAPAPAPSVPDSKVVPTVSAHQ